MSWLRHAGSTSTGREMDGIRPDRRPAARSRPAKACSIIATVKFDTPIFARARRV